LAITTSLAYDGVSGQTLEIMVIYKLMPETTGGDSMSWKDKSDQGFDAIEREGPWGLNEAAMALREVLTQLYENPPNLAWRRANLITERGKKFTGWFARNNTAGAQSDNLVVAYRQGRRSIFYRLEAEFVDVSKLNQGDKVLKQYELRVNKDTQEVTGARCLMTMESDRHTDKPPLDKIPRTGHVSAHFRTHEKEMAQFTGYQLTELHMLLLDTHILAQRVDS
jgi:hypothetical protein